MRKERPREGDMRIRKKFLLFPKTMYNPITRKDEMRWLETTSWVQTYVFAYLSYSLGPKWHDGYWYEENANE